MFQTENAKKKNKEKVWNVLINHIKFQWKYTFDCDGRFIGKVDQPGDVENRLCSVVEDEKAESESCKVHDICSSNGNQVDCGISDSCWHVFTLDLLEVQLWVAVKPVSHLDDEEELEHESHGNVGVVSPQGWNVEEEPFTENDISTPQDSHNIEEQQLARFIELALLYFGQVKLGLDFLCQQNEHWWLKNDLIWATNFLKETYIQNVLLNHSMDYNTNEGVEEDGTQIL